VSTPREQPIPPTLAARPRHRRGLPIPPVNVHPDSTGANTAIDFTTINIPASTRLALDHRCSLCGEPFEHAFRGGLERLHVAPHETHRLAGLRDLR
jgi:hypothetical protein